LLFMADYRLILSSAPQPKNVPLVLAKTVIDR
jgi:hypothetical protein